MAQTIDELLSVEKRATVHVLCFHTKALMDPAHVDLVEAQFGAVIDEGDSPRLVLDLENLEHVSSVMLSALIEARALTLAKHGRIATANMHPRLKDLLEIVRIHDLFENYASVESAVIALLD